MTDVTISAEDLRVLLDNYSDHRGRCWHAPEPCGDSPECERVERLDKALEAARAASSASETPVQPEVGSRDDRTSETPTETFVAAFSKAMHEAIIDGASDDDATRAALAVVVRYVQRREAEYYARRFKENRDNETSAARRAAYAHAVVIAEVRRRWLDNREGSTP
jgi:hypothetical protein